MLSRLCLQRNNALCCQRDLERSGIVPHQSDCGENPSQRNEGSKYPVLPSNGSHRPFVLGAVGEESCRTLEPLATDGQPNLRRLLHIAHPLAVHICGADVELLAVRNEPDRYFVGLPGLPSIMSQGRGLLARYPLQSRKYVRFHKLSFRKLQQNQQKA
jgi:hypothetical protein